MRIDEMQLIKDAHVAIAGVADGLVITDIISAAEEVLRVAVAAEQTASASVTKAEGDMVTAKLAADKAAHTPGSDMLTAALAEEQAERLARVAARVFAGATSNRVAAAEALARARGEAYRPVAQLGAKRMVDACGQMEAARKMMNDSMVAFRAGELLLLTARQKGTLVRGSHEDGNPHRWVADANGDIVMPSADAELKMWIKAGLIAEAPKG